MPPVQGEPEAPQEGPSLPPTRVNPPRRRDRDACGKPLLPRYSSTHLPRQALLRTSRAPPGRQPTHPTADSSKPRPRALNFSPPPFCPCCPWRPERPGSPWHCGWPRCWGPRPAGSPAHSARTRGPASHHNRLPPRVRRYPWLCCCPPLLPPPGQTLSEGRDSSPARSSPSPPVAAIPASAAEAAAALLASSSCRCLCSSMETRRACRDRDRQGADRWRPGPAWHLPPRPGWGS
uniref:Uncharacterized protein n=1 Tax=Falco tinnunculus TaxID=100819 RepID=A0A8C4XRB0_FALTI